MEQVSSRGFEWVTIRGGHVFIGAAAPIADPVRPNELPAAVVVLPTFSIGRTPVTNDAYAAFVRASGHRAPAHWEGPMPSAAIRRHPVTSVDRQDALAYCAWAGVRLPTEAEWEKAARGTDGRRYPWGEAPPTPREANIGGWFGGTTEVGTFPAGASPSGVLDLAGGVWEWTASLERPYPYDPADGREDQAAAGRRVLRGGSFNHLADDVRCAARSALHGDACDEYIGFRVALDGEPPRTSPLTDWVTVSAGPFRMGSDPDIRAPGRHGAPGLGGPRHAVEVEGFRIARTPVTNAQYAVYVAATGARPPGHWEGQQPEVGIRDHPVTYVDWHEARAFCAWAGVRLPTEAEWELAAAGADGRAFPWGAAEPGPSRASFGQGGDGGGPRPVTERALGATPDGVLDMAGNVWEWTSSLHLPYPYRAGDGREDPTSVGPRVLRGGSFRSPGPAYLRCAFRSRSHPTRRRDHLGFRVAIDDRPGEPAG